MTKNTPTFAGHAAILSVYKSNYHAGKRRLQGMLRVHAAFTFTPSQQLFGTNNPTNTWKRGAGLPAV